MTALPLLFQHLEVLDSNRHRGLRRRPRASYRFAAATNAVPVTLAEIPRCLADYPVVFAGSGEQVHLAAVVGLTADSNLFVDGEGRWQGRYVPAYLRGYPFSIARLPGQAEDSFTVIVDPASEELGPDGGEPLFEAAGGRTPYLVQVVEFLRHYEAHVKAAQQFARRIEALGLLSAVSADVRLKSGQQFALSGLRVVDRERLKALAAGLRNELFDSEGLEAIYLHLTSLNAFAGLVDRLAMRQGHAART
jgi:hypothetical protein